MRRIFRVVVLILTLISAGCLAGFIVKVVPRISTNALSQRELWQLYFTKPALRDLIHLIAEHRILSFKTVWDTSTGVLLSKKIFRPIKMEDSSSYGYLPHLTKLSFQAGVKDLQRKFEAVDSKTLRSILSKLDTAWEVESHFDERGFRQTPNSDNADCPRKILFIGDSFTEGLWVTDAETFVNQFASMIKTDGKCLCVINAGVNGYGVQEESFTARNLYPEFKYQTLFLIHYPNDVSPNVFELLQGNLPTAAADWQKHNEHLKKLADFAKSHAIQFILVPIPPKEQFAMPESRKNYQDILKTTCADFGIVFKDPYFDLERHTWEELYLDWDPHFNASGHRIFAQFVAQKALTSQDSKL